MARIYSTSVLQASMSAGEYAFLWTPSEDDVFILRDVDAWSGDSLDVFNVQLGWYPSESGAFAPFWNYWEDFTATYHNTASFRGRIVMNTGTLPGLILALKNNGGNDITAQASGYVLTP